MIKEDHEKQEVERVIKYFETIEGWAQNGAAFMRIKGLKNDESHNALKWIIDMAKKIDLAFYKNFFPIIPNSKENNKVIDAYQELKAKYSNNPGQSQPA